jgi:hypothetical protein
MYISKRVLALVFIIALSLLLYLAFYINSLQGVSSPQLGESEQYMHQRATEQNVVNPKIKPVEVKCEQVVPINKSEVNELGALVNNDEEEINGDYIYDELASYYDGSLLNRLARDRQAAEEALKFRNSYSITEESIEKEEILHSIFSEYQNNNNMLFYDAKCNDSGCEIQYKLVEGQSIEGLTLKLFKSLRMTGGGFSISGVSESDNSPDNYLFFSFPSL